jgi:hypothetical protein
MSYSMIRPATGAASLSYNVDKRKVASPPLLSVQRCYSWMFFFRLAQIHVFLSSWASLEKMQDLTYDWLVTPNFLTYTMHDNTSDEDEGKDDKTELHGDQKKSVVEMWSERGIERCIKRGRGWWTCICSTYLGVGCECVVYNEKKKKKKSFLGSSSFPW